MIRPLLAADVLIQAVRSGAYRIVLARVHPEDLHRLDLEGFKMLLGAVAIGDGSVERGTLFVDTVRVVKR